MNLIRTERTYKTAANATKALEAALAKGGRTLEDSRHFIAVAPDGRFAPVLVGVEFVQYAHIGISVVG